MFRDFICFHAGKYYW